MSEQNVARTKVRGLPLTDRMKRYGITGLAFVDDHVIVATLSGSEEAPLIVGHWLAELDGVTIK